jgi:hypothetical protein
LDTIQLQCTGTQEESAVEKTANSRFLHNNRWGMKKEVLISLLALSDVVMRKALNCSHSFGGRPSFDGIVGWFDRCDAQLCEYMPSNEWEPSNECVSVLLILWSEAFAFRR